MGFLWSPLKVWCPRKTPCTNSMLLGAAAAATLPWGISVHPFTLFLVLWINPAKWNQSGSSRDVAFGQMLSGCSTAMSKAWENFFRFIHVAFSSKLFFRQRMWRWDMSTIRIHYLERVISWYWLTDEINRHFGLVDLSLIWQFALIDYS